jgi:hypothetical protein
MDVKLMKSFMLWREKSNGNYFLKRLTDFIKVFNMECIPEKKERSSKKNERQAFAAVCNHFNIFYEKLKMTK